FCRNQASSERPRFLHELKITKARVQRPPVHAGGHADADASAAVAIGGRDGPPLQPVIDRLLPNDNVSVCSKPVCEHQDAYLRGHLDEYQEPCEDFYAFVCSRAWVTKNGKVDNAPYRVQTTAKLMYDLPKTFHQYFKMKPQTYYNFPGTFVSQAIFFIPNCTSIYSRNGHGWDPWQEMLTKLGLQGWPFTRVPPSYKNISAKAGHVDRSLGIFPFAEIRVTKEYVNGYVVQLDSPKTILRRHQLWYTGENLFNYTQMVSRALSVLGVLRQVEIFAENIVILEMRLEEAIQSKKFSSPSSRTKAVVSLSRSAKWNWLDYIDAIFGYSSNNIEKVDDLATNYFKELAEIMDNTSYTTLANYIGYRLMVHLSPLLPDEVDFLVPLSMEKPLAGIGERFQACVNLLEKLFPFGMRTFLRMSLGDLNPLKYSTLLDSQIEKMFNHTQHLMSNLVNNAYWFNPVEKVIATEKIQRMDFAFMGTVRDLSIPAVYYDPQAPPFDGSKILQSFFAIQAKTKQAYFDPWHRTYDLDNQHHLSSLQPDIEYDHGRNQLFVPYAVLAFLKGWNSKIEPLFSPIVSQFLLRGIFMAVDERGSFVDHHNRPRDWWSKTTIKKFGQIKDCFRKQYRGEMQLKFSNADLILDMENNIVDNAIVAPLYDYYLRVLGVDTATARKARTPIGGFTAEQLFFVYYALSHCEQKSEPYVERLVSFGETPPSVRVNIPLRNFVKFSEAFGCQSGNEMSPQDHCFVW
ncbi:unnamed protein product, partial [Ixodes hexagonus]